MSDFILAVHGGAGALRPDLLAPDEDTAARSALAECLTAGRDLLARGGSALDAVESCVVWLEASEPFNAGRGSVLTSSGCVEMDAAIMDGATRSAGSVACVSRLAHPISAARLVMERSPHALLVGEPAERFAQEQGVALVDPQSLVTAARREQLERARARQRVSLDHDEPGSGTVGAVARDASGHLAAATSTGGMTNQLPGRVGDSGLIGAGTWADDETCAVSGTGQGELYMRCAFAHEVDALQRHAGLELAAACERALARVLALGGRGGCVAVDRGGKLALPFTTPGMYRGWIGPTGEARVAVFADEEPC